MLTIAGQRFDLTPESVDCPNSLAPAYFPFISSDPAESLVSSACYRVLVPDQPRLPSIDGTPFWSNEIWRMGNSGDQIGIEIFNVIRSRWIPVARLNKDFSCGDIQPFHGRRAEPAPHALNYPYDQAILINRLLIEHVAVIHGAGIEIDGRGYVFFGPSGIGKTTISRLWRQYGANLLNDDRVAIYRSKTGEWRLAGTPWHGEEPVVSPRDVPLGGVVRLRQSGENRLRQLSPVEGLSELLSCALIPFFSRTGIEMAMDLMTALPDAAPLVEFSFQPNPDALDYFLAAI